MPKRGKTQGPGALPEAAGLAASTLSDFFRELVWRGESPVAAQRLTIQCVILLFLEGGKILPSGSFRRFLNEGIRDENLDPFVPFEFQPALPILPNEMDLLTCAAQLDWSQIHPAIFGTILQKTMHTRERHVRGAHYTPAHAIREYVIRPSLIEPWSLRIQECSTPSDLLTVGEALSKMRILDPACGSGNFLYEAHAALREIEQLIIEIATRRFSDTTREDCEALFFEKNRQLFGIDVDPLAVELARVTMLVAEMRFSRKTIRGSPSQKQEEIRCADALFCDWPKTDLIIGNPPFQSKNRMQREFGPEYVKRLRENYPDVPGRADYCVYFFRRAHDELENGARAGLVGTNTIRQNYSREGGLDHIVKDGGTITEAVSTMVWPGEAIVHVSVVNWIRGAANGLKKLSWQNGDSLDGPWQDTRVATIAASLSAGIDVTAAKTLRANADSAACFQGQTHGHEGFLLSSDEARSMVASSEKNRDVVFPYLTGDDLLSNLHGKPSRWVIDFHPLERPQAQRYSPPFQRLEERVLPDRTYAARAEEKRNEKLNGGGNQHHTSFLRRWWQLSYPRSELMQKIGSLARYIVCSRVTKRPIFEFVSSHIHPSDALMVFPFEDDYSFGILQSILHWAWFTARCSTLTARFRYTSETVFNSFPWPQTPTEKQCLAIAQAAIELRKLRQKIANEHSMTLRSMYASMETTGQHALKDAHAMLDDAVRPAYGMSSSQDSLAFLLELNQECASKEMRGEDITGPGLPTGLTRDAFVTSDCIEAPSV